MQALMCMCAVTWLHEGLVLVWIRFCLRGAYHSGTMFSAFGVFAGYFKVALRMWSDLRFELQI